MKRNDELEVKDVVYNLNQHGERYFIRHKHNTKVFLFYKHISETEFELIPNETPWGATYWKKEKAEILLDQVIGKVDWELVPTKIAGDYDGSFN